MVQSQFDRAKAAARLVREVAALNGKNGVDVRTQMARDLQSLMIVFSKGPLAAYALTNAVGEVRVGATLAEANAATPLPSIAFNPVTKSLEANPTGAAMVVFLVAFNMMLRQEKAGAA